MNVIAEALNDGSVNLTCKQGSTWELLLKVTQSNGSDFNLSGFSARGQIRKLHSSTNVIKSFTCTVLEPFELGNIMLELSAEDSAEIACGKTAKEAASTYVYDVEIYIGNPEKVYRVLQGKIFVDPEVTK